MSFKAVSRKPRWSARKYTVVDDEWPALRHRVELRARAAAAAHRDARVWRGGRAGADRPLLRDDRRGALRVAAG